jgi:hypothetical protein
MDFKALLSMLRSKWRSGNRRLILAMACYCALALMALITLLPAPSSHDRFLLGLVLFVIAFLAIKTFVHSQDE